MAVCGIYWHRKVHADLQDESISQAHTTHFRARAGILTFPTGPFTLIFSSHSLVMHQLLVTLLTPLFLSSSHFVIFLSLFFLFLSFSHFLLPISLMTKSCWMVMFSLLLSLSLLHSFRCLWLYSPSYLQQKPFPQPYLGVVLFSVYITSVENFSLYTWCPKP